MLGLFSPERQHNWGGISSQTTIKDDDDEGYDDLFKKPGMDEGSLQSEHEEFLSGMGGMELEPEVGFRSSLGSQSLESIRAFSESRGAAFGSIGTGYGVPSNGTSASFGNNGLGAIGSGFGGIGGMGSSPIVGGFGSPMGAANRGMQLQPQQPQLRAPQSQGHASVLGQSPPLLNTPSSPGHLKSPSPLGNNANYGIVSPQSQMPDMGAVYSPPHSASPPGSDDGLDFDQVHNRDIGSEHPYGEHPSRTLFVRNINSNVDDEELASVFSNFGPIRGMYTQCKHRGFVMISYYDIRHAKNAMRHLQNKVIRRRKIDIHYSIPKENPSEKDQNQGTLVVFNLDPSTQNDELKAIFGQYGEIKEVRETPNKKHHKFIEFYDVRDAERAMKVLNKTEIKGKKIKIEPSRPGGARKNAINGAGGSFELDEEHIAKLGSPKHQSNSLLTDRTALSAPYYPSFSSVPSAKAPLSPPTSLDNLPAAFLSSMEALQMRDSSASASHSSPTMFPPRIVSPASAGSLSAPSLGPSQGSANSPSNGMGGGLGNALANNVAFSANNSLWTTGITKPGSPYSTLSQGPLSPHLPMVVSSSVGSSSSASPIGTPNGSYSGSFPSLSPSYGMGNNSISPSAGGLPSTSPISGYNFQSSSPLSSPANYGIGVGGGSLGTGGTTQTSTSSNSYGFSINFAAAPATSPGDSKHTHKPVSDADKSPRGRHRVDSIEDKSQYTLHLQNIIACSDNRTTLMIKNIPNKYSQKMLLAAVDEHHKGLYDFFYLPIDFKNKCNVGYAFINFIHPQSIISFYNEFNNKKWEKFNSEKVCEITYARIQGKTALIQHFQNSSLMCEDKKCRPIIFHSDGPNMGEQVTLLSNAKSKKERLL